MTDLPQLLNAAWPFVALLFVGYLVHHFGNATITVNFASRTHEPERDQRAAKLKMERDEARRIAEEMRRGGT